MNKDDYLEEEWPEENPEEPEAPAEEEESDRGLYTYDTAPSEEEEDKNAKASPEEADFQNAEHFTFRLLDDHRIYKMEDPPKIESKTKWYEKAEACFQIYFESHDLYYSQGFLHYIEPTLNRIASGFMLRYAMAGHFADLKQEAVLGLLEAEQHYDPQKGTHFLQYSKDYMKNRMHYYIRKMRRGCTVTTAYADKMLRTVMRKFYDHGGHNDLETICKVAEEMKIPQEEAIELIQCALLNVLGHIQPGVESPLHELCPFLRRQPDRKCFVAFAICRVESPRFQRYFFDLVENYFPFLLFFSFEKWVRASAR